MGFFDRDVEDNGLDDMFDFNGDGKIDSCEEGLELRYIDRLSEGKDPWEDD